MRFLNICEDMLLFFRGNETVDAVIEGFNIQFNGMNAEETKAELRLMIEKALAEIKELQESEDADASGSVSATVFISKAKKEIIRMDFTVQDTSEEVLNVALVCGPSMDALTEISLTTSGLDEDVSICYLVDENSETAYSAVLTVMDETLLTVSVDKATEFVKVQLNADGEEIVFTADKDGDAFRASLLAGGEEFGLNGSFIDTEEQYGLAFETVEYNGETIRLGKLSVVWNTEDEMPVIESFTDIMTMSEEELEALIQQVETAIQTLASTFVG